MRAVRARRSLTLKWSSLCIVVVPAFWDKIEERESVACAAKPDLLAICGQRAKERISRYKLTVWSNQVVK